MNPTQAVFEERVAALEGGVGALATASGQAARDDRAAEPRPRTAGTSCRARRCTAARTTSCTTRSRSSAWRSASSTTPTTSTRGRPRSGPNTKAFYGESDRQPEGRHPRLRGRRRRRARRTASRSSSTTRSRRRTCASRCAGAPTSSCTRRRSSSAGTARRSAGSSSTAASSTTSRSGRFPNFTEPDPSYHGLVFSQLPEPLRPAQYILKARLQYQRDIGAAISPFNAFLFLQGLETLSLRMERHSQNALAVAQWLEARDEVEWVAYPGLDVEPVARPGAEVPAARARARSSSFGIKGGLEAGPALHRRPRAVQPPRQRRRRAQPGDPPGVDHAPAARRPAEQVDDRRHARPRPAVGRHRVARRHPRRPRGRVPRRQGGVSVDVRGARGPRPVTGAWRPGDRPGAASSRRSSTRARTSSKRAAGSST